MALGCLKSRSLPFVSLCLILLLSPSLSEIHRARSMQTFKHRFRKADTDGKSVINEWSKWFEDKFWGHSRRVWLYSSISAGLVGLTGLFPLLVIPVNYGAGQKNNASHGRLKMLLSFAVGGLLGDVFLHLLPEAWVHVDTTSDGGLSGYRSIGGWILAGLLSFYLIEKLFGHKEEDDDDGGGDDDKREEISDADTSSNKEETSSTTSDDSLDGSEKHGFARSIQRERSGQINCIEKSKKKSDKKARKRNVKKSSKSNVDAMQSSSSSPLVSLSSPSDQNLSTASRICQTDKKEHIKVSGWLNLLANVVDNFTHGLAVAGSYSISSKMGVLTTLAILLHEIPHEIGDFAILLQAGFDRWKAAKVQVLTATGGIIGALAALSAESAKVLGDSTAWILPLTAGGFINIALITIVPDLLKETNPKNSMKQLGLVFTGILVMGLVTMLVD